MFSNIIKNKKLYDKYLIYENYIYKDNTFKNI